MSEGGPKFIAWLGNRNNDRRNLDLFRFKPAEDALSAAQAVAKKEFKFESITEGSIIFVLSEDDWEELPEASSYETTAEFFNSSHKWCKLMHSRATQFSMQLTVVPRDDESE